MIISTIIATLLILFILLAAVVAICAVILVFIPAAIGESIVWIIAFGVFLLIVFFFYDIPATIIKAIIRKIRRPKK